MRFLTPLLIAFGIATLSVSAFASPSSYDQDYYGNNSEQFYEENNNNFRKIPDFKGYSPEQFKHFLKNFDSNQIPFDQFPMATQNVVSFLETFMMGCRSQMLENNPQLIPEQIYDIMADEFEEDLLREVRFVIAPQTSVCYTDSVFKQFHPRAVTLIDVIVFRSPQEASNIALWSHELTHVKQFQKLGVKGFIKQYIQDHKSLERPAYTIQHDYEKEFGR